MNQPYLWTRTAAACFHFNWQDILSPPVKDKREKNLKPASTTTTVPGQLLGELLNPLLGANRGENKIRDPRAGQGLVEAAISATKAVSQLMGSVFEVNNPLHFFIQYNYCCMILQLHCQSWGVPVSRKWGSERLHNLYISPNTVIVTTIMVV